MRHRPVRLALPLVLAGVGVSLLAGCVFIPTFDKTIRGKNVSKYVGSAKQDRPIRLHAATRDDVMRVLGEPRYASPDRTRIAYEWEVLNGYWVWPLCFAGYRQEGRRALLLTFDEAGVLRTSEVLKNNGNWFYGIAPGLPALPRDMLTAGATRPATSPANQPATSPSRELPS